MRSTYTLGGDVWISYEALILPTAVITHIPHSKVHGANKGPTRGRQDPGGPHVGYMNLAIWDVLERFDEKLIKPLHLYLSLNYWFIGPLEPTETSYNHKIKQMEPEPKISLP